jgi:Zn finger protein HypA/HybF involved in hydrogenase expression
VAAIIGSIIYIALGTICAVGLIAYVKIDRKVRCKECSKVIQSSQIKCGHCGTIVDREIKSGSKLYRKINRREELHFEDSVKSLKRD